MDMAQLECGRMKGREGELYVKDNEARLDNNEPRLNSTPLTFASVVLSRISVLFMKTIFFDESELSFLPFLSF